MNAPEPALIQFLRNAGLATAGEEGEWTPLVGGVSSDIWRVSLTSGDVCVKRALSQLKVESDWTAPIDRNAHEWAYIECVARIAPGHVPRPIVHDAEKGLFAMAWLAPEQFRLWKSELLAGRADARAAAAVGALLGRIHAATAGDRDVADRFATDATFHALRIEPYLLATAQRHPALAGELEDIAATTASHRNVLVHGDVSPKNILLGDAGPVLLDAECAWFGDPAFDLAFCLNHLAIKARVVTAARSALADCFRQIMLTYFANVGWETVDALERRAARLLPALALARVDGKSPVEYLDAAQRDVLRSAAVRAVKAGSTTLEQALHRLLA